MTTNSNNLNEFTIINNNYIERDNNENYRMHYINIERSNNIELSNNIKFNNYIYNNVINNYLYQEERLIQMNY